MVQRKVKTEAEKSIPEMADDVTREEMRQMYKDGELTAYGRRMSKFLERVLPDEKVDEWGWSLSRKERAEIKRRAGGARGCGGEQPGRGSRVLKGVCGQRRRCAADGAGYVVAAVPAAQAATEPAGGGMYVPNQRRHGGDFGTICGERKKEKCLMGRVSAFLGMVLYMYPEKNGRHNRPHVHVLYGDAECVLSVPEGEVLAGEIPARQLRNAQTFIDMRTEELMLNWKLCMEGKDVVWVDPIR